MEKDFYVYVWYKDSTPIYVGKGRKKRAFRNKEVDVEIYQNNLTETEAFQLEKELIEKFSRKDLNNGTLENLTNGGGIAFHDLYWGGDELKNRHRAGLEKLYADSAWVDQHKERCKLVASKRQKNWQDSLYLMQIPSGEIFEMKTQELKEYCEKHNLSFGTLKAIARKEIDTSIKRQKNFRHSGYKVEFLYNKSTKFRQDKEKILEEWQR